jgi:hypothetical protein
MIFQTPLPTAQVIEPMSKLSGPSLSDIVEAIGWILNVLLDWFLHFCYSGFLGLVVFYLTLLVTQLAFGWLVNQSRYKSSLLAALEPGIWKFSFFLGLFAAWLAHIWWDGLLG